MTHRILAFSAPKILQCCDLLDNPILLYDHQPEQNIRRAILTFSPRQSRICFTADELMQLIHELPAATTATAGAGGGIFRSGWIGYFSYEAGHTLLLQQNRLPALPLAEFFECPLSLELNLLTGDCTLHNPRHLPAAETEAFVQQLERALLQADTSQLPAPHPRPWQPAWQARDYQRAFDATHEYLRAGDAYQVNLAMPFICHEDLRSSRPHALLESFRPAFGAYLKSPWLTLFSVSPERFIRLQQEQLETRPIKGTVARGATAEEDERNRQWLAGSRKNQAENLMIVDLLRNDLSRHAQPFSVQVTQLFQIETHANVHHMVSTITARLQPHTPPAQVIADALPGGSVTGAPKKRAMEIIAELEARPRGPYCGSLGYFDDAGHSDFNILIRTIVATAAEATCWAGGGIVMDSTCAEEWQELHTKVQRILDTPL